MKQFSLSSLRTIAYSHLFLSLCPAALIVSTCLIIDNSFYKVSIDLLLFVFCSSLFIYNLNVLFLSDRANNVTKREAWMYAHKKELRLLLGLSGLGVLYFSLFISIVSILFLLHLCLLSVLYVLPLHKTFSVRKFPLIKIFILTYVWTSVTVVLPCIEMGFAFNFKIILLALERFLFIFTLALLFDVRDIELDRNANLLTIPGILGVKYAIGIPKLLLVVFVLVSIIFEGINYITIGRLVLSVFTFLCIEKAKVNRKGDWFYMFGVDGLMIFQFIILLLLWTFLK